MARARRTDPATSHAAASRATASELTTRDLVICAVGKLRRCTDEQMHQLLLDKGYTVKPSGPRSRRSELTDEGFIRWTGEVTDDGRNVWELTANGEMYARRVLPTVLAARGATERRAA